MRLALISDLHGNLIAFDTVLDDVDRSRPDAVVCLGDVAATGPQPHETVERLRDLGCPVVMGNADAELLRPPLRPVPPKETEDRQRIREIDHWCAARLSSEDLEYLRGFRPTIRYALGAENDLLCFHGSPRSYDDAITVTTPDTDLDRLLSGHEATVMAGGHTHEQFVRRHRDSTFLNPGSVGLNPPFAEYAMVGSTGGHLSIELRRLPLPLEKVRRAALDSGMPHAGWWADFWTT